MKQKPRKRAAPPFPPSSPGEPKPDNVLNVPRYRDETEGQALARSALRPTVSAALSLKRLNNQCDDVPLGDLVDALVKQCDYVQANQLERAESMLITQAHTLDALFNRLVKRAALNEGEYLQAADQYFRLALRAQSQCRATLESLAMIKNPPHLAFVKQANIGQAVQVNNGAVASDANAAFRDQYARAHARGMESEPNKLLEHSNGERLDFGAPAATGEADSTLEAVGALHGATNGAR